MQQATATIPIVSIGASDPVAIGLVKSLARPGGNITGVTNLTGELGPKQLEMLIAMTSTATPKVTRVAVLLNPTSPSSAMRVQGIEAAAKTFGIHILPVEAQNPAQIDAAFAKMRQQNAGALIVLLHPFF